MEITLTDDIEKALVARAKERGTTPEQLALESLRREFVRPMQGNNSAEDQKTLAEYLSDFIGILYSSEHVPDGARLSESTGEAFVKALVEKRRQGRL